MGKNQNSKTEPSDSEQPKIKNGWEMTIKDDDESAFSPRVIQGINDYILILFPSNIVRIFCAVFVLTIIGGAVLPVINDIPIQIFYQDKLVSEQTRMPQYEPGTVAYVVNRYSVDGNGNKVEIGIEKGLFISALFYLCLLTLPIMVLRFFLFHPFARKIIKSEYVAKNGASLNELL